MKIKSVSKTWLAVFFLLIIGLNACEKDTTTDPTVNDRDKYLGVWQGTSTGPNGTRNFNMNFTASNSAPEQILMSNFDGAGTNTFIAANVSGSSFSIVRTLVNGEYIAGSGTYNSNNTLAFSFTVDDGQTVESRTGTARR